MQWFIDSTDEVISILKSVLLWVCGIVGAVFAIVREGNKELREENKRLRLRNELLEQEISEGNKELKEEIKRLNLRNEVLHEELTAAEIEMNRKLSEQIGKMEELLRTRGASETTKILRSELEEAFSKILQEGKDLVLEEIKEETGLIFKEVEEVKSDVLPPEVQQ